MIKSWRETNISENIKNGARPTGYSGATPTGVVMPLFYTFMEGNINRAVTTFIIDPDQCEL